MASFSRSALVVLLVILSVSINTVESESPGSCPSNNCAPNSGGGLFGLWSSRASTTNTDDSLSVRGGGGLVQECATPDDVEAALVKAGTAGQLVVIDFSATWCGPCKMISPLFEEMAAKLEGLVTFLKVDVDDNPDTAAKYSVSAMPTFVFIKAGEVVDRLMGANPARLQELIDELK